MSESKRLSTVTAWAKPKPQPSPHPADLHVGRQIAIVYVQSDVSLAQLARSIGISFSSSRNTRPREILSALHALRDRQNLGRSCQPLLRRSAGQQRNWHPNLGLAGPGAHRLRLKRGRRLIERLTQLPQRVRGRVATLISALGDELAVIVAHQYNAKAVRACAGRTQDGLSRQGSSAGESASLDTLCRSEIALRP